MAIELGPSAQAEQAARRQLLLASRLLRYSDYWEYGEGQRLSVEEFSDLVKLATLELFHGDPSEEEIAELLGISPSEVRGGRRHPQYESVRDGMEGRFRELAGSRNMKDWADILESELSLEMAEIALSPATKGRQKTDAASAFLDRQSAKAGRGDGEGRMLLVPTDLLELMERAQKTMEAWKGKQTPQRLLVERSEEIIEGEGEVLGSKLNVPTDEP